MQQRVMVQQGICSEAGTLHSLARTSGQSLAASTKTGMNATWLSTVSTTESPSTNSSLLRPNARLVPVRNSLN